MISQRQVRIVMAVVGTVLIAMAAAISNKLALAEKIVASPTPPPIGSVTGRVEPLLAATVPKPTQERVLLPLLLRQRPALKRNQERIFLPVIRFYHDRGTSGVMSSTIQSVEPTSTPTLPPPTPTPTPTLPPPTPTPTPTIPWPPSLEEPGESTLGLHLQWNNSPEIMEFIRRMKPAVIKAVGDLGFLAEVKRVSPSTVIVARLDQSLEMQGDPVAAARAFVAQNLATYQSHTAVDYWEGINEPQVRDRMAWYATFEAERVRVMAEHGLRTAIGSFSTGVPEWEEFAGFLPAIEAAKKHGGILTLHEYDAPTLDRSVGAGLPGRPNYPDRGSLALRYRWWYEDFLKPLDLVIPLVISEAGVDGGVGNRPGPPGRGWQDFIAYWAEQGLGDDGIQAYARQLVWYDAELRKDDYVIGFALFTAGAMSDQWKSYDVTHILRHIATYVIVGNP